MKETITLSELKELNACSDARRAFEETFGQQTTIKKLIQELHRRKAIYWEAWLLSRNAELTESLLHHGADVHTDYDQALRWASIYGSTEVVKLLLEHGTDVHALDDYALRWASYYGHTEVISILKKAMKSSPVQ